MIPTTFKSMKRYLRSAFGSDSKVQARWDEVAPLRYHQYRVLESAAEEVGNGTVIMWLNTVGIETEAAEHLVQQKYNVHKNCFVALWPNFRTPPMFTSELLPSRVLVLNQIMDALKDPSVNLIGIHGLGGVGKTTLAKRVCSRSRDEGFFDNVIMIAVSRFPNLRRIQAEIAAFFALKFDSEEVLQRAGQLYQRLQKGKLLIILDDVWQKLDLHTVGIPFGDECQGCKLLISSRRKEVLSSEMGSQKDFLVDVLSAEESWSLFQTFACEVQDLRLNPIAIEIAKRCAGLPLLIKLVYLHLKNKQSYEWVDMLEQLSVFGNEVLRERVHKVVEYIFENLPGEEFKSLFLLCASFAQSNIQIQHLLIYGMGLHLFSETTTIEEARRTLFHLINALKLQCLLLDGDLDGHVKLHDVVRDAAIVIASRVQNSFVGGNQTTWRDWPNNCCSRISVPIYNSQDLPSRLQYPKAELIVLSSEELCLDVPDSVFDGTAKLQVVDFTGIHFATRLPSSLGCLRNLDTLCLHRCHLDNVSVIGELTELEFLSFAGSNIIELPREIEALSQLKLLDLTNCSKLQVIPANVIAKLFSLQELYMCNSYVRWGEKGNANLMELEKLSYLSSLEIHIVNPNSIPKKFTSFYNGLRCCAFVVGKEQSWWENHERSRMIKLIKLEASVHLVDAFELLLRRAEVLHLDEVSGISSVLDELIGYPHLRHLCIKNDNSIHHLFKSTARISANVFPALWSLLVDNLNSLEMICDCPQNIMAFRELRILKVRDCGKLKSLFSFSSVRCLWLLQEMEVESCENMEAIVGEGSGKIEFAHLSSLKLKNLPRFKGFCKEKITVEVLFHDMITFPNLMSLEVKNCKSLKYVFTRSYLELLLQLKRFEIHDCESVEEIIWRKESDNVGEEDTNLTVFCELNYVSLKKLKNLKWFSCGFPIEFSSLAELSIHGCPAMEYFTSAISDKHPKSEGDELLSENVILYYLDGKIFPRLAYLHIQNGHGIQCTINLKNLNCLESLYFDGSCVKACYCNELENLFSFLSAKCSTELLQMEVQSCHSMKAIIGVGSEDDILELTQLKSLKVENLPHLIGFCEGKEGSIPEKLLFNNMVSFPNLTSLVVEKCNSLKHIFTASMVKCLVHLRMLEIRNCESVEAIIQSDNFEQNEEIINTIVFHNLDVLSLCGLPNVKVFVCGCKIEFPLLRDLSIECPAMEDFVSKFIDRNNNYNGDDYLFSDLVTFSNLESMTIRNMHTFRYLCHEEFILLDLFSGLKSLNIANCSRLLVVFPANTFRRFQKLETLLLSGCDGMEEIFQFAETEHGEINRAENFSLREVQIVNLASLKHVFPDTIARSLHKLQKLEICNCNVQVITEVAQSITCFRDTSLVPVEMPWEMKVYSNEEMLEFPQLFSLKLKNLPHLSGFCNRQEQGFGVQVSFPSLKDFELCQCKNFKYVFALSMVDSLMQLEKLEIDNCELVEEILSQQFDKMEGTVKIVFPKLEYLSLGELPNLKTFDFGFPVQFPSLKELSISDCPVLKNFVSKSVFDGRDECLFNDMVTFSKLERMKVCHNYGFEYLWDGRYTVDDSFLKLKSLRIEYCSKLTVVFPSNMHRRFQGIETLYLTSCSRVEEIFQYEGNHFEEINTVERFSLRDLDIWNLPSLKYIWSTDPPGDSTFEYLRSIKVFCCQDLKFVFPKSIAQRLLQLQSLKIANSHMGAIIANTDLKESNIVAPQLAVLQLENLYQMKNLYEGLHSFKCPELKQLDIYGSNQEMNFISEVRSPELPGRALFPFPLGVFQKKKKVSADQNEISSSFVKQKIFCNLEELTLDDQGLLLILGVELGVEFSKLKKVTLRSLEEESIPALIGFLRQCSLEKLVVVESYLEEMFLLDDGEEFSNDLLLEHLEIVGDDNMKHILKNDSRANLILEKLQTLNVEFCESLIDIAPSSASFRNLTYLHISACCKMMNLVTASTAETMTNLMELKVSECSMIEEIVKDDEVGDPWINFDELKRLELYDLPMLNSFSSSVNFDFRFPLLDQVFVKKCLAMKDFCSREAWTPKLKTIHLQDEKQWKGDLNATIASQVISRVTNTHLWET